MTKEKFKTKSQGEDGQTFEVNEIRKNHDAAVRGYIFLLLIPFSFVKLF